MNGFFLLLSNLGYHHPVHPTQVMMPIGLVVAALLLSFAVRKREEAAIGAKRVVLLAFLFLVPTALAGFMDWWHFFGAAWVYPFGVKVVLAVLLVGLLLWAVLLGRRRRTLSVLMLGIYSLAFIDVVALGYFGGEAVFGQQAPAAPENRIGETVYRYNCSGCHPFGGNSVAAQHPVIGSDKLGSAADLTSWIRHPAPPVPSFALRRISDDQAARLSAYLKAWRGKDKGIREEKGRTKRKTGMRIPPPAARRPSESEARQSRH